MKNITSNCWAGLLIILALFAAVVLPQNTAARQEIQDAPSAYIEPAVLGQIRLQGQADYWVIFADQADLSGAYQIKDWNARGWYVYKRLTSFAEAAQADLEALLSKAKVKYTRYWIVNAIYVTSGEEVLEDIARQPEVKMIAAPRTYTIPKPESAREIDHVGAIEWNISRINAPQVWSTYSITGTGIVVANIGLGVQYNHPALVNQYRGNKGGGAFDHNYNWYDPSHLCSPATVPCDTIGLGTHVMGIMVGDDGAGNQIGVAPGARFISAKACTYSCSEAALLASAQWVLAPTDLTDANPRPDLRPHVVDNSWGSGRSDTWFQATVQSWVAAGIFPVFPNGSTGASCYTTRSPADYPESYSVGYFDSNNAIHYNSSRGPSQIAGGIKPNISAPGVNIRSSYKTDSYYTVSNGAMFASPHVAATVALMWAASPTLVGDVAKTRNILDGAAIDTSDLQCGGTAENNNVYGQGRLDAFIAVSEAAMSNRLYLPIVMK